MAKLHHNQPTGGHADPAMTLKITVVLGIHDQAKLDRRLLADQQNPSSAEYHHWLTPAQFARRFGPAPDRRTRWCSGCEARACK